MVKKYRKKPVVIEAVLFTGHNANDVLPWIKRACVIEEDFISTGEQSIVIETLEGDMRADPGDYIIKGVKGGFYPCKPDIFEATYEPA